MLAKKVGSSTLSPYEAGGDPVISMTTGNSKYSMPKVATLRADPTDVVCLVAIIMVW